MSKTFSTNVTNGVAGGSHVVFIVQIDAGAYFYRYATSYLSTSLAIRNAWLDPTPYPGGLSKGGISQITRKVDFTYGGNFQQQSTFTIQIPNAALASDTLYSENFVGREVQVRMIFLDETSPSWNNALPIIVGYVQDVSWDLEDFTFHCGDSTYLRNRNFPSKKIDATAFPSASENVLDKPYPIVYGSFMQAPLIHKLSVPYWLISSSGYGSSNDYALGYVVKHTKYVDSATADGKTLLAGHDIKQFKLYKSNVQGGYHASVRDESFFQWDDDLKSFCPIGLDDGDALLSDGSYFRENQYDGNNGNSKRMSVIPSLVSDCNAADGADAVDEDISNYATLTDVDTADDALVYTFTKEQLSRYADKQCGLYFATDFIGIAGDDKLTVTLTKSDEGTSTFSFDITSSVGANTLQQVDFVNDTGWDFSSGDYDEMTVAFKYVIVGGSNSNTWHISNIFIHAIESQVNSFDTVFWSGKGREFGEWVDSEEHDNTFDAEDLIENPAYIAESIYCDELGISPKLTGAALYFSDTSSYPYMSATNNAALNLSAAITIEAWIYPTASLPSREQWIIAKLSGTNKSVWGLALSPDDGYVRFYRGAAVADTEEYIESEEKVTAGQWNHVLVTHYSASGEAHIYVNGVDKTFETWELVDMPEDNGSGGLRLACKHESVLSTTRFCGIIDDVRVKNVYITPNEIYPLYNHGNGTNNPDSYGCVGWWNFDSALEGGTGSQARTFTDGATPAAQIKNYNLIDSYADFTSTNHGNCLWKTKGSEKIPYRVSQIVENVVDSYHSFDWVADNRSSWLFARDILNTENSTKAMQTLAYEAGVAIFTGYDGREDIGLIDNVIQDDFSGSLTISDCVLSSSGKPSTKISMTQLKDVITSFTLRYKKNYASGNFEKTLFCTTPDGASFDSSYCNFSSDASTYWGKLSTAYTQYKTFNTWDYGSEWIRDDATAELFIKFMINKLARRAYIFEQEGTLAMLKYELCDLVKWSHPIIPPTKDSADGSYDNTGWRLISQTVDPNTCIVKSTWLDVGICA